ARLRRAAELVELQELAGLADLVNDPVAQARAAGQRRAVQPPVRTLDQAALRIRAVRVQPCRVVVGERVENRELAGGRELEHRAVARVDASRAIVAAGRRRPVETAVRCLDERRDWVTSRGRREPGEARDGRGDSGRGKQGENEKREEDDTKGFQCCCSLKRRL